MEIPAELVKNGDTFNIMRHDTFCTSYLNPEPVVMDVLILAAILPKFTDPETAVKDKMMSPLLDLTGPLSTCSTENVPFQAYPKNKTGYR